MRHRWCFKEVSQRILFGAVFPPPLKTTFFYIQLPYASLLWCTFQILCTAEQYECQSVIDLSNVMGNMNNFSSIFYLSACYMLFSLPSLSRAFISYERSACERIPTGQSFLIIGTLDNTPCVISFILTYYFSMASSLWWLMLTFTWYLYSFLLLISLVVLISILYYVYGRNR